MISIIIPTYNAEKTITSTIKALLNQNYPKNKYEIIVVDDGSTDKTVEVVPRFPVKLIKLKHKGPANARNVGAKRSKGSIILFTDSDCVPDKNWIKNMTKPFEDKNITGVSGTYRTLNKDNLLARFVGYDIQYRHEKMRKKRYIDFVGTFSAGYRKSIFLKEGGFDTSFPAASGEDPELSYRIAKKHKIVFQPSAFVWHPHPDTLKKFLKQKFSRPYWRFFMYSKHKNKILGDSYTSANTLFSMLFQVFLTGALILWIIMALFISVNILTILGLFLLVLFVPNLNFVFWVWKYDKTVSLVSPFLYFVRNLVYGFGLIADGISYLSRK